MRFYVVFVFMFFVGACGHAGPVKSQTPMTIDGYGVGQLLNQTRMDHRRRPVRVSMDLMRVAHAHARDMAENDYFSHTSLDGTKFDERIKRSGFAMCFRAENIARGVRDGAKVMRMWIDSPKHQVNNISPKSTHYGVGEHDGYWVLVLAEMC